MKAETHMAFAGRQVMGGDGERGDALDRPRSGDEGRSRAQRLGRRAARVDKARNSKGEGCREAHRMTEGCAAALAGAKSRSLAIGFSESRFSRRA